MKSVCEFDGVAVQPFAYLNLMHGVLRMAQKYKPLYSCCGDSAAGLLCKLEAI